MLCTDRLLLERTRRNKSHQAFDQFLDDSAYPDAPPDLPDVSGTEQQSLKVIANRLPVTCSKDASGHWQLQVCGHISCL